MKTCVLILLAAVVTGIAADGERRPLVKPKAALCRKRPDHFRFGNHRYALSWKLKKDELGSSSGRVDWLTARNFCRERFSITTNLIFVLNFLMNLVALKFTLLHNFYHDGFNVLRT